MKLSKKKTLQILAYCATSAIFFGGFMSVASAEDNSDNTVNIVNETVTSDIVGGDTSSGDASNNTVNISGSDTSIRNSDDGNNGNTLGGRVTGSGNASNNTINIDGGTIFSKIHVGEAINGKVSNNVLNIRGGNFTGFNNGWISGAYLRENGTASGNVVNIYGGDFNIGYIEGSWGAGTHTNNVVNIYGGNIHGGTISGAWVTSNTTATGNETNISGGTISGGATIAGAYMNNSGNVRGNSTNVSGGNITGDVHGGYVKNSGDASGNSVNVSGGKITGEILGGYVGSGTVTNNAINISGNPDLSGATIFAGKIGSNTDLYGSGNSLNFFTKRITAKNIGGFDTLNFTLPAGVQNGDTILTLTDGTTNLTKTKLNVNANGSANLVPGNQINLLTNTNGINISDITTGETIAQGISLDYGLTLGLSEDGTAYTATVGAPGNLKRPTDLLGSAIIDSAGLLDSGTDRLAEWLPPEGLGESIPTTQFNPFAGLGGSVFKIKTSDGQKLKSKNAGLDVGMARFIRNGSGMLVFGPITDYGRDSYESRLTHPKSENDPEMYTTEGSGTSQYFAAGIIARQMTANNNGMYYEGSLRGGRVRTNFSSDNFLVHNEPTHAEYSASTPCFAGHVRIGWAGSLGGTNRLDAYGIYSLNRVNGFTTTLSTGEEYKFSAVNSGRMRIGARLTREDNKNTFYSGLAFVHEFTGETVGEYLGRTTNKVGMSGSSGLIELGWRIKQSGSSDTMFDASMVGWVGHQKGVTFSAKFKRDF
ncbi:MAG: hypothetical protein J5809_06655 [Selenomonadaceae bacterium]|nr:hypothetical protein [Selenomonadaceae bacterium]